MAWHVTKDGAPIPGESAEDLPGALELLEGLVRLWGAQGYGLKAVPDHLEPRPITAEDRAAGARPSSELELETELALDGAALEVELRRARVPGMLTPEHVAALRGTLTGKVRELGTVPVDAEPDAAEIPHPAARPLLEILETLEGCAWGARLEPDPSPAEEEAQHRAYLLEHETPLSAALILEHEPGRDPSVVVFLAGESEPDARLAGRTTAGALERAGEHLLERLGEEA